MGRGRKTYRVTVHFVRGDEVVGQHLSQDRAYELLWGYEHDTRATGGTIDEDEGRGYQLFEQVTF